MGNVRKRKRVEARPAVDPLITAKTLQPTFEGRPCPRCDSRLRFKRCSRCVRCHRQWRRDNEARYYRKYGSSLFRKLGITPEQYYEMAEAQEWRCLICKQTPNALLHVDHCHITNKIRGLLCGSCNIGLGHFKENLDYLAAAIEYLRTC